MRLSVLCVISGLMLSSPAPAGAAIDCATLGWLVALSGTAPDSRLRTPSATAADTARDERDRLLAHPGREVAMATIRRDMPGLRGILLLRWIATLDAGVWEPPPPSMAGLSCRRRAVPAPGAAPGPEPRFEPEFGVGSGPARTPAPLEPHSPVSIRSTPDRPPALGTPASDIPPPDEPRRPATAGAALAIILAKLMLAGLAGFGVMKLHNRNRERRRRYPCDMPVTVEGHPARLADLSRRTCRVVGIDDLEIGRPVAIDLGGGARGARVAWSTPGGAGLAFDTLLTAAERGELLSRSCGGLGRAPTQTGAA